MTTTCKKCLQEEEHSVRPNGQPQSQCKKCQRAYSKEHYKKYYPLHNKRRAARRKADTQGVKKAIRDIKESSPCTDCGVSYPYYVMQFDHIRGEKSFEIARAVSSHAMPRLLQEIEKCDLVCANCHMERTHGPKSSR